jgi:flagellar biosynthesis chaperone FliJ
MKSKLGTTQREIGELDRQLKAITDDQTRLRANLEKVPPTSAAYKRYLEKFDNQETEIEKLQDQTKKLRLSEEQQRKEYEGYLVALNVE